MNSRVRCRDKAAEERMGLVGFAVEFRMKLARDEKRMLGQLNDFNQLAVRSVAAENEAAFSKRSR